MDRRAFRLEILKIVAHPTLGHEETLGRAGKFEEWVCSVPAESPSGDASSDAPAVEAPPAQVSPGAAAEAETPVRRGPGRPRKSDTANVLT